MTKKVTEDKSQKCYNSFSCILSCLIILFVMCSIIWDITISKPEMRHSINEIRIEVKDIHNKIDRQYAKDSAYLMSIDTVKMETVEKTKDK